MNKSAASFLIHPDASEYVAIQRIPKQIYSFLSVDCDIYSQAESVSAHPVFFLLDGMSWASITGCDEKRKFAYRAKSLQRVEQFVRNLHSGRITLPTLASEFASREVPIGEFSQH
jgi:hypothetical protein